MDFVPFNLPVVPAGHGWCARCRQVLPAAEFRPNPRLRSGLNSWCNPCQVAKTREWRAANRDKLAEWRRSNAERLRAKDRERYTPRPLREKTCETCGIRFVPIQRNQQRYCSVEHREIRHRNRPAVPKSVKRWVLQRDNWTCYLCGDAIPQWIPWPRPLSATVDHVIPWSKGGLGTPDNLRAAHWHCNRRKADQLLEAA